jgi:hypothetical protein
VYSLRFSLYRFDASTLAGDDVLGSLSKLRLLSVFVPRCPKGGCNVNLPLNACQDGCNIVRGRPSILQDIQAQLPSSVYIGMEHLADELDTRRLVGVGFFEVHYEAERSIFKRRIGGAYYDRVPNHLSVQGVQEHSTMSCAQCLR